MALAAGLAAVLAGCTVVSQTPTRTWGANSGAAVEVYAVAHVGNRVLLGGNFTSIVSADGSQSRRAGGLAALSATSGNPAWTASPGGTVYRIVVDRSTIWVAGTFGLKHYSLTGVDLGYKAPKWVGQVHAVAVGGGRVYYAGSTGVVASTPTGKQIWSIPIDGQAYDLQWARKGRRLMMGGLFCTVRGLHRPALVSLGTNGAVDKAFHAAAFGCGAYIGARSVLSISSDPKPATAAGYNEIFVGAGGSLNRVVAVNATTGAVIWAAPRGDGDVQSVSAYDGSVYAGGHFDCVAGGESRPCLAKRAKIARYSSGGVLDSTWTPELEGGFWGVQAMVADSTGVYIGGNFDGVNEVPHSKYAKFPAA